MLIGGESLRHYQATPELVPFFVSKTSRTRYTIYNPSLLTSVSLRGRTARWGRESCLETKKICFRVVPWRAWLFPFPDNHATARSAERGDSRMHSHAQCNPPQTNKTYLTKSSMDVCHAIPCMLHRWSVETLREDYDMAYPNGTHSLFAFVIKSWMSKKIFFRISLKNRISHPLLHPATSPTHRKRILTFVTWLYFLHQAASWQRTTCSKPILTDAYNILESQKRRTEKGVCFWVYVRMY